jgi:hypothetical protein
MIRRSGNRFAEKILGTAHDKSMVFLISHSVRAWSKLRAFTAAIVTQGPAPRLTIDSRVGRA